MRPDRPDAKERARGVEPQAATVTQKPTPLLSPTWVGRLRRRAPKGGLHGLSSGLAHGSAAPVSGLPRPLGSSPLPQQDPHPAYTLYFQAKGSVLVVIRGGGDDRDRPGELSVEARFTVTLPLLNVP
jgi:hypothetical protein